MLTCRGIEHEHRALEPLNRAVLEIGVRDVAATEMHEKRLAGMMRPPVLDDVMNVVPGEIALGKALRCVKGKG